MNFSFPMDCSEEDNICVEEFGSNFSCNQTDQKCEGQIMSNWGINGEDKLCYQRPNDGNPEWHCMNYLVDSYELYMEDSDDDYCTEIIFNRPFTILGDFNKNNQMDGEDIQLLLQYWNDDCGDPQITSQLAIRCFSHRLLVFQN